MTVYPHDVDADELAGYDGVLLSNGPGDPEPLGAECAVVRELVGRVPLLGIESIRQGGGTQFAQRAEAEAGAREQTDFTRLIVEPRTVFVSQELAAELSVASGASHARRELEEAQRDQADAEGALARAESEASAAGALAGRSVVTARFAGVIAKRWHKPGDMVEAAASDPILS